jgi:hypothetical protein
MRLSPADNVAVALRSLKAGETVALDGVALVIARNIPVGHKLAARAIAKGELIVKYSCPIGTATAAIEAGEHLHAGNVATSYLPTQTLSK